MHIAYKSRTRPTSRFQEGLSLIELLLVVSIVLVLAAIAVPNYLSARNRAKEASAVASLRTIAAAQVIYATEYPAEGYADDVAKLGNEDGGVGFVDWAGGCSEQPCMRGGYSFSIAQASGTPVAEYLVVAVPSEGASGSAWYSSQDYLVMEFVEGDTLSSRLQRGPLALEQVLKTGTGIAEALDNTHRSGIVHRGPKPGNIILTKSGAKLLDFGLTKPAGTIKASSSLTGIEVTETSPVSPITQQRHIVGTLQYMSPEQVEGKEADAGGGRDS